MVGAILNMKCPCENCICVPICRHRGIHDQRIDPTASFTIDLSKKCKLLEQYLNEGIERYDIKSNENQITEYQLRIVKVRLLFNIDVTPNLKRDYYKQKGKSQ